jgi:hypothetical protein
MLQTHGHIDEGMPQKLNLMKGSTAVSLAVLETSEDVQCGLKDIVYIHQ